MRIARRAAFSFAAFALAAAAALFSSAAHAQMTGICGRTAQVQTAILDEIDGVTECAAVTATHLAGVTETLDLAGKNITSLQVGDFSGLSNITRLDLDNNALATLADHAFSGLTNVTRLDLDNNALVALADHAFSGLTNLTELRLQGNALTSVPDNAFGGLARLATLQLQDNELANVPVNALSGLTNLQTLLLDNNSLTSVPANAFSGLTKLTMLFLQDNALTSVAANAFSGLTELTSLFLGNNALTTVPANAFSGLTKLTTLFLEDNALTSVAANAFSGLTNLTSLFLRGNDLTTLPANAFNGLARLTALDLTGNALAALPVGAFSGLVPGVSISGITLPSAPGNLTATASGRALEASWSEVSGAHYYLSWKRTNAAVYAPAAAAALGATSYTIANLAPGAAYDIRIAALFTNPAAAEISASWNASAFVSGMLSGTLFGLDVNRDGAVTAADGILVARYLHGVTEGDGLTDGQAEAGAGAQIAADIQNGVDDMVLDVDGSGTVNATDGILTARHLLGLRGDALTMGFAGLDAASIGGKIDALRP